LSAARSPLADDVAATPGLARAVRSTTDDPAD
jgi:hypothetical protein